MSESPVARAYDAAAGTYDRQVAVDAWVRQLLWRHYARAFEPGQHVLDVACGTGIDSLYLAERGLRVTAVDVSPQMIVRLRAKAAAQNLEGRITAHVFDLSRLGQHDPLPFAPAPGAPPPFDGILSAFAGLNALPDLQPFATTAARLLKPRGRMILHMLNRFSLWEWLGLVARARWRAAWRLGRQTRRTFVIGHEPVPHLLYYPLDAYRTTFAPAFDLLEAYSIGALRPPSGARRVPAPLARLLERLERRWSTSRPFLNWGRFFVLDLARRP